MAMDQPNGRLISPTKGSPNTKGLRTLSNAWRSSATRRTTKAFLEGRLLSALKMHLGVQPPRTDQDGIATDKDSCVGSEYHRSPIQPVLDCTSRPAIMSEAPNSSTL